MKKVLAMLGLALTVLISTPAVHAATTDSGTVSAPVIIRDITSANEYSTVIIRDIQTSPTQTVIIRDLTTGYTPDWTVIIRNIAAALPNQTVIIRDIKSGSVIIRDAKTGTVIIRDAQNNTVIIRDLTGSSNETMAANNSTNNSGPIATVIIRD
ncbi:MAG: hypothetical protein ACXVP2_12565 [Tumebacillaceae bacterium]